ncbi:response regulator transcription factor [Achromobacter piechaudii]|uniref:Transcriptional regulatory protein DegU n=1 Tax=Achromobacter piechaudii TaxID=72556 RepID=A0ABM8L4J3_9BURK|nr:response regulator transcription factor [Achromobacter piechaudii]CAB3735532.1 Transcriptional regulatory protein DegU [Achromobacter piechaudii]CAB3916974.1 Transcriptional regulatory protein DegU [Achromobacter piechaudii]CAB3955587.1 Transcriptional regulatory protein DegU [Achromobacter piechaudii]
MPVLLIADDHPLFREALRGVIGRVLPGSVIHEADQISALYDLVDACPDADLLLLDLDMPGSSGLEPLGHLRARHPPLPIVIVSAHEDPLLIRRSMDHGAMGFIPKSFDAETLGAALRHVLDGGTWWPDPVRAITAAPARAPTLAATVRDLTPQQFRVLQMVGAGLLNKQIAHELQISEATIKAHMTAIMRKLRVTNRTQAVLIAGRLGLGSWRYGGKA